MLCVKRELEIRRPLHMRCQTGAALLLTPKGMEKKSYTTRRRVTYIPTLEEEEIVIKECRASCLALY
jgi:hypothetical protein